MSDEMKRKIEDAARDARTARHALQSADKKQAEAGEAVRKAEIEHEAARGTYDAAAVAYKQALRRFEVVTGELLQYWD